MYEFIPFLNKKRGKKNSKIEDITIMGGSGKLLESTNLMQGTLDCTNSEGIDGNRRRGREEFRV